LAAGAVGGAVWAGLAGWLKARTGAHEVITTIMLNYVALLGTGYLLSGLLKDPSPFVVVAQTPKVLESARLPSLFTDLRVHWGLVLALLLSVATWWLLFRSTIGFAIRTVGLNPSAARYAGISIAGTVVLTMALSGALAGLAGGVEVLGVNYYHTPGFSVGYGFDSIAVALLGKNHPLGVIPAALLFGGLRAGATRMQFVSQIPIDVISIVQGIILLLVAADELVRRLYRVGGRRPVVSAERVAEGTVTRTWGRAE
jgi:general nucleoside transport system permease protein